MMDPRELQICCCGARSWSLVIGWLRTIFGALSVVLTSVLYFLAMDLLEQVIEQAPADLNQAKIFDEVENIFQTGMVIALIFSLMDLIGGIFLLVGVYRQNRKLIIVWIVLQAIFVIAICILALLALFAHWIITILLLCLLPLSFFFVWVVGAHLRELDAESSSTGNMVQITKV